MKISLLKEFKEFAVKGNMIDIAVGVIIGASFNKVVDVLVKDIFLPPLSLLSKGFNWADKRILLRDATIQDGVEITKEIAIGYGKLIEASFDFLIIGFTIFIVIKSLNAIRARAFDPKDKTISTPKDIELLDKIGDLMEEQVKLLKEMNAKSEKSRH